MSSIYCTDGLHLHTHTYYYSWMQLDKGIPVSIIYNEISSVFDFKSPRLDWFTTLCMLLITGCNTQVLSNYERIDCVISIPKLI